jgi:MHS family proline/betaine transporter-like MFS transporter
MGVLGGSTPLVATWLIAATGNDYSPAVYHAALATNGVVAILMSDETKDVVMD